eukprot:gb/GECG01015415.1/.p1 GENE.gb/GECG01015415.1/~~gb/GECG01015415.1/.p1  ORF type:complete len:639 (+),score=107.49 gb/GECG01015415.1/:1-1917(+)
MDQSALAAAKARAAAVAAKYSGGGGGSSGGSGTGANSSALGRPGSGLGQNSSGGSNSKSDAAQRAASIAERLGFNLPPSAKRAAPGALQDAPSKRKRIEVPNKPGINFTGLLIGSRGSTQKYLEQESGCRILLRGQGTNRDPNFAGEDDDEPLHVTVEGHSDEAIEKAENLIQDIIDNPEKARAMGQERDHYGPGASTYTEQLQVPNTCVGTIIGRGGETIRGMQQRSGANIQLQRDAETPVGATERTVTISGQQEQVEKAKELLEEIVKEQEEHTIRRREESEQPSYYQPVANLQITVPNDRVGLIIGTRGRTIAGIQDRTGARIQIPKGPDTEDPSHRTITITAESHEAANAAQTEIEIVTQGGDNPGMSIPTVYVDVPNDKVGSVIGKGGATIRDIQERTGTKIQIPPEPDFTGIRKVAIRGTQVGCEQAQQEVLYIVQTAAGAGHHAQPYGYGIPAGQPAYGYAPAPAMDYTQQGAQYYQQYPQFYQQPQDPAYQAAYQPQAAAVDPQQQQQQPMAQAQPVAQDQTAAPAASTQDPVELWRQYEAYYAQFGWKWDYENNQWAPIEGFNPASAPAVQGTADTSTSTTADGQPQQTGVVNGAPAVASGGDGVPQGSTEAPAENAAAGAKQEGTEEA